MQLRARALLTVGEPVLHKDSQKHSCEGGGGEGRPGWSRP